MTHLPFPQAMPPAPGEHDNAASYTVRSKNVKDGDVLIE
jgi:hypothetical protein